MAKRSELTVTVPRLSAAARDRVSRQLGSKLARNEKYAVVRVMKMKLCAQCRTMEEEFLVLRTAMRVIDALV